MDGALVPSDMPVETDGPGIVVGGHQPEALAKSASGERQRVFQKLPTDALTGLHSGDHHQLQLAIGSVVLVEAGGRTVAL